MTANGQEQLQAGAGEVAPPPNLPDGPRIHRKKVFIRDFEEGKAYRDEIFVVRSSSTGTVRSGKNAGQPFWKLQLGDKTGSIRAVWFGPLPYNSAPAVGQHLMVFLSVETYGDELQGKISGGAILSPDQVAPEDFLPTTDKDVNVLHRQVLDEVSSLDNPQVKLLLTTMLNDLRPRLVRAPAAMTYHHAYLGGLMEHIHSLVFLGDWISKHAPYKLDKNYLIAGAVLHDIGKLWEQQYDTQLGYTTPGKLLNHVYMGAQVIMKYCEKLKIDKAVWTPIQHIILSHHGKKEHGALVEPMTKEAYIFHCMDKMDATMAGIDAAVKLAGPGDEWTGRVPILGTEFFMGFPC